eukprot:TRINITY_DN13207_c0_g1_i1.p1 TRINITY_DN13207_c0_g1~~TRINITY_DN13207_c0_g1_i1.p1  ORF type:complete len:794 (-),score=195.92 TRINITY_DN13207_c0_g1_i1:34-2415(-)
MPLNTYASILRVHIKNANGLRDVDLAGKSDPFVEVEFEEKEGVPKEQKTHVIENNLNPVWNTDLFFLVEPTFTKFKVTVRDKGTLSDKKLGFAHILRKDEDVRHRATGDRYYLEDGRGATIEVWTQEISISAGLLNLVASKQIAIQNFLKAKKRENHVLLAVAVHGAKNLPSGLIDKSDPYAKIDFDRHAWPQSLKTPTIDNNPNPVWNTELQFLINSEVNSFKVDVYDDDPGKDKHLGSTSVVFKVGELKSRNRLALGKKGEVELSYIATPLAPLFEDVEEKSIPPAEVKVDPPVPVRHEPPPVVHHEAPPEYSAPPQTAFVPEHVPVFVPAPEPVIVLAETHHHKKHHEEGKFDGQCFVIRVKHSAKVLDVVNASPNAGAGIHQWSQHGGASQKFKLKYNPDDGSYFIQNMHSKKFLDIEAASKESGGKLAQWDFHGGENQRFKLYSAEEGSFTIESVNSGLFLDVSGGSPDDGAYLHQWVGHDGGNQRFYFEMAAGEYDGEVFRFKAAHSAKVLDVQSSSVDAGAQIWQFDDHGSDADNQKFLLKANNDGSYSIWVMGSGKVWDIEGGSTSNGGKLIQWDHHGGNNQKFVIKDNGDGTLSFQNVGSGLWIDVSGASHDNCATVHQWDYHGGANQRFFPIASPKYGSHHEKLYVITAVHSGKVLDVDGVSLDNGAKVHQWDFTGANNQKWRFVWHSDNFSYTILAGHSGKAMDVAEGSTNVGALIHQWDHHKGNNQKFRLRHVQDDQYAIQNVNSGKWVDVSGVSYDNGAVIHQWDWANGENQKFRLQVTE